MNLFAMERGKSFGGLVTCLRILLLLLCCSILSSSAQEDFNCHEGGGLLLNAGNTGEKAAIIPRGDIIVPVGGNEIEVLCRFNSTKLNVKNVFFSTRRDPVIPHEVVNSSTIRIFLQHSKPARYTLFCKLKKKDSPPRELCSQFVKAGGPPSDVENFSCIAPNYENINCTWTIPDNNVKITQTNLTWSSQKFHTETDCPRTNKDRYTWCYWDAGELILRREEFDFKITRKNALGTRTYTHHVVIPEIVYPNKVASVVSLVSPLRVKVAWNITYPLDVFKYGLFHRVEYRIKGADSWQNVTEFFHQHKLSAEHIRRNFDVELAVPYAFQEYEFRVRIHSGFGDIKEELWSPYDILSIMSEALPPSIPPRTSKSTFETAEGLDTRDIYVDFQHVEELYHGGRDFHYKMLVYPSKSNISIDIEPSERTNSYFKFKFMNFTEYRFEIIPVNEKGEGSIHSEVIVPHSDCIPKKTEMFTVITRSTPKGKMYSLYWSPSLNPINRCAGADLAIDSYTVFWCKKSSGDRCKETLFWQEISNSELVLKDLSDITTSPPIIFEKNFTDLPDDVLYTFGVAASTGIYSSGIRWSSCIVDENEPPIAPQTEVAICTNITGAVEVRWSLKCSSLSAIPVGFNVSYCKSNEPDFGHCFSPVEHKLVNSPTESRLVVPDLTPGINYIFSVSLLSLIGEGRQSIPKIMRLRDEIPSGPPTKLKVEKLFNTSALLVWNPPLLVDRKGLIKEYRINTVPNVRTLAVAANNETDGHIEYILHGLKPFTSYDVKVAACTTVGCGYQAEASTTFRTKTGIPDDIEGFNLDVSNWRLHWSMKSCNSVNCSFEIKVPINESLEKTYYSDGNQSLFSLHEAGLLCNYTEMSFFIRAKGQDEEGHLLYGNWFSAKKSADECPQGVNYLMIFLVCSIGFIFVICAYLIMKFGWSAVKKAIKDCKQNINLPKGIQATESVKDHRKDFSSDKALIAKANEPSFLLLQHQNSQTNLAEAILREDRGLTKLSRDSVSSEEVNLIDTTDHDRHGRNMSGGSGHSSGNDSALMSESPSGTETDQDALSQQLEACQIQETTLRQRNPGPAYVQHGVIPDKISEGYVTAHSVPSLPHLYVDGLNSLQQSTPNLNNSLTFAGWVNARRASTGYISMPESDTDSPMKRDPLSDASLSRVPPTRPQSRFPPYSRYSFNPNLKLDSSFPNDFSSTEPSIGYTIADMRPNRSPSPPTTGNTSVGYVSAGDPFGALKRQPSLPLISKDGNTGEEYLPLGAYCRVGSRVPAANQGYVSAGPSGSEFLAHNVAPPTRNPYVSYGEAAIISSNHPPISKEVPPANSPYVELSDGGRWAQPVTHSMPVSTSRLPTVTSAPMDSSRMGRVVQLPRPNTTEASIGHRRGDANPSLSKQSSGYVSQETITPYDAVVMSPKRLMTQAVAPHTVIMSPSHQASMV